MAGHQGGDVGVAASARGRRGPRGGDRRASQGPLRAPGSGRARGPRAAPRAARRARHPPRLRGAGAVAPAPVLPSRAGRRGRLRRVLEVAVVLKVFRWSPGARERLQKYWVKARQGMTVLDALVEMQRASDPTLAFRYACRVGMCGSCGMVINGRERWACRTLLSTLARGAVTVRPLYHFPLIRDLVVDMAPFKARMLESKAVFVAARRGAEAGFAQIGSRSRERRTIDAA